jgi:tRNA(adenine34) deaminase
MNYEYFMGKALAQAEKALAMNEFPVGCIIVCEDRIVARSARIGTSRGNTNEIDHAEILAIQQLAQKAQSIDKSQTTLFCTMEPCLMCFAAILLSGIRKIVYAYEDIMGGGTTIDLSQLPPLYQTIDCTIVPHILRDRSLSLFKAYFNRSKNDYWRDSLLARYTLNA